MAAGRATIITELAQQADLPTYDPRSWTVATAGTTDPAMVTRLLTAEDVGLGTAKCEG